MRHRQKDFLGLCALVPARRGILIQNFFTFRRFHLSYKIHVAMVEGGVQFVELRFFLRPGEIHLRCVQILDLCVRLMAGNFTLLF